jgi:acyl dehydratase
MSMLTWFSHQVFGELGITSGEDTQMFNFGFNRVRMPEPVPAGAEIRGRFTFGGARIRDNGGTEITVNVIVDIKGNDRPALVAEWLFVAVKEDG